MSSDPKERVVSHMIAFRPSLPLLLQEQEQEAPLLSGCHRGAHALTVCVCVLL